MNSKNVLIRVHYSDKEVEADITKYESELIETMRVLGRQDGEVNKPTDENEGYWLAKVYNTVVSKAKSTLNLVQQKLLPVSDVTHGANIETIASQNIQKAISEKNNLSLEIARVTGEAEALKPNKSKMILAKVVMVIILIAGCSDGVLAYNALLGAGILFIQALVYGLAIAVIVFGGSHFGAMWIGKSKDWMRKMIKTVTLVVSALFLFLLLGMSRATAINNSVVLDVDVVNTHIQEPTGNASGLVIGLISWFIFCSALFFSTFTQRTNEEKKKEQEYKDKLAELDGLQDAVSKIEQEIKDIQEKALLEKKLISQKSEYALVCKKRILDIAKEALSTYANSSLTFRTDNICPLFFSIPPDIHI